MNTAEKVETIVTCYLANGTKGGTLGSLVRVEAFPELGVLPCYRVVADGCTFIVRSDAIGWRVQFGPMTGHDPDLYTAAKFAIEERNGRCVGTVTQALGLD